MNKDLLKMVVKDKELDPIDVEVGKNIRMQRLYLGLSQDNLAKLIGLTFQQVQKYESGKNRVSVSRLLDIAKALKVHYSHLMPDYKDSPAGNQLPALRSEKAITMLRNFQFLDEAHKDAMIKISRVMKGIK